MTRPDDEGSTRVRRDVVGDVNLLDDFGVEKAALSDEDLSGENADDSGLDEEAAEEPASTPP